MRNTINLFMWGFQQHFRTGLQREAERVFKRLDPGFVVNIFLLGLIKTVDSQYHPVCLEPEDCGWKPSDFLDVREDIISFIKVDGEDNLVSTTEIGNRAIQSRRTFRATHSAVMKALGRGLYPNNSDHYFSGLAPVGNYDVGIILSVAHEDGLRCYRLPQVHAEDRYQVPISIVGATAEVFIAEGLRCLHVPEPEDISRWNGPSTDELLRKAANRFMEVPNFAARSWGGLYALYDACNYISSLTYEGDESAGGIIISRVDHPNIEVTIKLAKPVRIQKYRTIRKLLEISKSGESILSDGEFVIGFGHIKGVYDQLNSDLFLIRFLGHYKWEILHDNHPMMAVMHEIPRMPSPPLNYADFASLCKILMPDLQIHKVANMYELALSACKQRHGTVLVFTPEAAREADRLSSQATLIAPKSATDSMLESVSAIDGAILLDEDGICYAIGVILDGQAIPDGDTGRGARYNSTLRYITSLTEREVVGVAIVVSEDGTSEIMPHLPRQISKKSLLQKEEEIDILLGNSFDVQKCFGVFNWLDNHRFYLSESLCEKANELVIKHNAALWEGRGMTISREIFKVNNKMTEAFYVD